VANADQRDVGRRSNQGEGSAEVQRIRGPVCSSFAQSTNDRATNWACQTTSRSRSSWGA